MKVFWNKNHTGSRLSPDKQELILEIRLAQEQWMSAKNHLDWVNGVDDEIDYVIYEIAAAEKKYELLLKQAKKMNWENTSFYVL